MTDLHNYKIFISSRTLEKCTLKNIVSSNTLVCDISVTNFTLKKNFIQSKANDWECLKLHKFG